MFSVPCPVSVHEIDIKVEGFRNRNMLRPSHTVGFLVCGAPQQPRTLHSETQLLLTHIDEQNPTAFIIIIESPKKAISDVVEDPYVKMPNKHSPDICGTRCQNRVNCCASTCLIQGQIFCCTSPPIFRLVYIPSYCCRAACVRAYQSHESWHLGRSQASGPPCLLILDYLF